MGESVLSASSSAAEDADGDRRRDRQCRKGS